MGRIRDNTQELSIKELEESIKLITKLEKQINVKLNNTKNRLQRSIKRLQEE